MTGIPLFLAERLRLTTINKCGTPIEGNGNRLVTKGFIRVELTPNMSQATEQEIKNGSGDIVFTNRGPESLKYHDVTIQLCSIDPEVVNFLTGIPKLLSYDSKTPIGLGDLPTVRTDRAVAVEVWSGFSAEGQCSGSPVDADLANAATISGAKGLYGLFGLTQAKWASPLTWAEESVDVNLTGITLKIPYWGRGPYNVLDIDATGTAGRLLDSHSLLNPSRSREQRTLLQTAIAPPDETNGAVPLRVASIFTAGKTYYDVETPTPAPAVSVAPPQTDTPLVP